MTRTTKRSGAAAAPSAADRVPAGQHAALHGLPAIWLRGNCPCADCLDPGSGQRLVGVADVPADVVVATITASAFDVLTATPVTFSYADPTTGLRATRPLISLDPRGRIREIRFNGRSLQPVRLPAAETMAFYAAYRRFAELIGRPEQLLTFRLAPGDCLIVDNTRIRHARTGFTATGHRHLQGCYADLDGLASTVAVLDRDQAGRARP